MDFEVYTIIKTYPNGVDSLSWLMKSNRGYSFVLPEGYVGPDFNSVNDALNACASMVEDGRIKSFKVFKGLRQDK